MGATRWSGHVRESHEALCTERSAAPSVPVPISTFNHIEFAERTLPLYGKTDGKKVGSAGTNQIEYAFAQEANVNNSRMKKIPVAQNRIVSGSTILVWAVLLVLAVGRLVAQTGGTGSILGSVKDSDRKSTRLN